MAIHTAECSGRTEPHPGELLPPAPPQDPTTRTSTPSIEAPRPPLEAENTPRSIRGIADIGRMAIVKWQTRTRLALTERNFLADRPRLRRTVLALGSVMAVGTLVTLASRAVQAYTMTRHGMHFGLEDIPSPLAGTPPSDTDNPTNQMHTMATSTESEVSTKSVGRITEMQPVAYVSSSNLASSSDAAIPTKGIHHYGGVRIEGEDYADNSRLTEPWKRDRDCVWNWAKQDLAAMGHRAGLSDAQIRTVVNDDVLVDRVADKYISSNSSIKNAPNHWLYDGKSYDTTAARTAAEDIVEERYGRTPAPSTPQPPSPAPSQPPANPDLDNKPAVPVTPVDGAKDNNSNFVADAVVFVQDKWEREFVSAFENGWNLAAFLALAAVGALAYRRKRRSPTRTLYEEEKPQRTKKDDSRSLFLTRPKRYDARHRRPSQGFIENVRRELAKRVKEKKKNTLNTPSQKIKNPPAKHP